jgi:diguanylate cyclase (GGDEF)-like protein
MAVPRPPLRIPLYWSLSLLAFLLALGAGVVLAWSLDTTAPQVNVAGRQRMYLQKMAVEALAIAHQRQRRAGPSSAQRETGPAEARARLRRTIRRFERAHRGLLEGWPRRNVAPVVDPDARGQLQQVAELWADYRAALQPLWQDKQPVGPGRVSEIVGHSRKILEAMDAAVARIQEHAIQETRYQRWLALGLIALVGLLLLFAGWAGWIQRRLERFARTDPLTGLCNRAWFEEALEAEEHRAARYGHPFAVALFDLDHFKQVNDRYGHETGDRALQRVASLLHGGIREPDQVCRWGGEELVVLLPETGLEEARKMAERLRHKVADSFLGRGPHVTISGGVAAWVPGEGGQRVVRRADGALYRAKEEGRNRIAVWSLSPQEQPLGESDGG